MEGQRGYHAGEGLSELLFFLGRDRNEVSDTATPLRGMVKINLNRYYKYKASYLLNNRKPASVFSLRLQLLQGKSDTDF